MSQPWPDDFDYCIYTSYMISDMTLGAGSKQMFTFPSEFLRGQSMLTSAVPRLLRSYEHLAMLREQIDLAFRDNDSQVVLSADRDQSSRRHFLKVAAVPDLAGLSDRIADGVFDVIGNLRSSLDKLAWKSASQASGGLHPGRVHFPIIQKESTWDKDAKSTKLLPEHWSFLREFQPFTGVNDVQDAWQNDYIHPLTLINELANDEKHRDDWPILWPGSQISLRRAIFPDDFSRYTELAATIDEQPIFPMQAIVIGENIATISLYDEAPTFIPDAGRLKPTVSFPGGRGIVQTLERMTGYVHFLFSDFARHFPD